MVRMTNIHEDDMKISLLFMMIRSNHHHHHHLQVIYMTELFANLILGQQDSLARQTIINVIIITIINDAVIILIQNIVTKNLVYIRSCQATSHHPHIIHLPLFPINGHFGVEFCPEISPRCGIELVLE